MVYLYFYPCPKENRRAFWQARLSEILQTDWSVARPAFTLRPDGKPALQNENIFFNVSHSRNRLVIAVSDAEVGVDIEFYDRAIREGLRRYCLTETEHRAVPDDDARAFLRIWTAKESYLKLYGTGLRQSMRDFSVLEDTFSSPDLPPAFFYRIENKDFTVCIATEQKQNVKIQKE
ncbi:MAG: 4'-phosphopantetheinyl transferase superfamily protein [Clostridia bacterium]|nr:4'-phosphopantetheinyl transferase superfamily protein [Clostridia bacterium]